MIEGHRFLAFFRQPVVNDIEHLEERSLGRNVACRYFLKLSLTAPLLLPPNLEVEVHEIVER